MKKVKKIPITIYVEISSNEKLDRIKAKTGASRSAIIQKSIKNIEE